MKAEYREVISLLHKGYSIRDVAKVMMKENELTYSMPAWDAYTKATPHLQQLNETIVGK